MQLKKYAIANWKMNMNLSEIKNFTANFQPKTNLKNQIGFAPQSIYLHHVKDTLGNDFIVGAQNISEYRPGAYTGDLAAQSLNDFKLDFTLVGHSERRQIFNENSNTLKEKVLRAFENSLTVVYCIGETLAERESGKTNEVLREQIESVLNKKLFDQYTEKLILAYEPVWAIGTGKAATPEMANETHQFIREFITQISEQSQIVPILYGGSVKKDNVKSLIQKQYIDGALVGGASLDPRHFAEICDTILLD
jgi:triosephosphate isomerase